MKEIHVAAEEWDSHYQSPEAYIAEGRKWGECEDGDEFTLVRLQVFAQTTYRIVDGKPVPVQVAFPKEIVER